jgi:ABC-type branched-subunit amino acid transport system substrate-binding protein
LGAVQSVVDASAAELAQQGLSVEVVAFDDRGQQSVGQQQATTIADDPRIVAVVGSTSSFVDEGVQPILGDADVAQLSLGGNDAALTRRGAGQRPFPTYVTYAAGGLDRAAVAASTGVSDGDRVAVLHGPRREDSVMADAYAVRVERAGGTVVLDRAVRSSPREGDEGDVDRAALRSALAAADPDVVYAAVPEAELWDTVSDVRTVAPRSTLVLDELALGRWSQRLDEQRTSALDRGTVWGPVLAVATGAETPQSVPETASTDSPGTEAPDAEGREVPGGRFAAAATDATALAVASLSGLLQENRGTTPSVAALRAGVLDSLRRGVVHEGTVGAYSFDRFGVATKRLAGVYERVGESWRQRRAVVVEGTCRVTRGCSVGSVPR